MAEYIERESLAKEGWYLQRLVYGDGYAAIETKKIIDIPASDVREVVTCGECAYADSFSPTCTESTFPLKCLSIRYGGVYPDWFCEHGERAQKTNC